MPSFVLSIVKYKDGPGMAEPGTKVLIPSVAAITEMPPKHCAKREGAPLRGVGSLGRGRQVARRGDVCLQASVSRWDTVKRSQERSTFLSVCRQGQSG